MVVRAQSTKALGTATSSSSSGDSSASGVGLQYLKAIAQQINLLTAAVQAQTTAIQQVFPNVTGTSTSATAGSSTLPATPAGFMDVSLPDGTGVKVPYYGS